MKRNLLTFIRFLDDSCFVISDISSFQNQIHLETCHLIHKNVSSHNLILSENRYLLPTLTFKEMVDTAGSAC